MGGSSGSPTAQLRPMSRVFVHRRVLFVAVLGLFSTAGVAGRGLLAQPHPLENRGTPPRRRVLFVAGLGLFSTAGVAGRGLLAQPTPQEGSVAPSRVRVPSGTFRMGLTGRHASEDEQPVHRVTLRAFEIDRTEVTVAAYAE